MTSPQSSEFNLADTRILTPLELQHQDNSIYWPPSPWEDIIFSISPTLDTYEPPHYTVGMQTPLNPPANVIIPLGTPLTSPELLGTKESNELYSHPPLCSEPLDCLCMVMGGLEGTPPGSPKHSDTSPSHRQETWRFKKIDDIRELK